MSTRPPRGRLVRAASHVLPAGELRERYRQEFLADLYDRRRPAQLRYSLGVLAHVVALRIAVGRGIALESAAFAQRRSLLCRLHLHHFDSCYNPDGEFYLRCRHCGEDRYDPQGRPGDVNIGGNILGGITSNSW